MDIIPVVADMVRESERFADELSKDRVRAIEYYQGEMKDTPSDEGRSKLVTRDVRAHIKKVLPSVVRTILGSDEVVEFQPMNEGDEEGAQQASDYINYVLMAECGARDAIYDAVHDALLLRNGILRWWFEEKQAVKISRHTGLAEEELAILAGSQDTEVLESTEREEQTDLGPLVVYDVKIRRTFTDRRLKAAAVPRERFLIHPDAVTLDDSLLTGEKTEVRRSDLIAMGYDRETIDGLSLADEDDYEADVRRDTVTDTDESQRANDPIDYYDLYIRVDMDDDGISELRHMCFAGGLTERNLLINEECDEVQYTDICVMRQPHQWEGVALSDDLMDIQQVKTVLLRQTADNLYWQNNPQPIIQDGAITDKDAVFNPDFGLPITVKDGYDVRQAVGFTQVPFVAKDSFGMLEYMDQEATDRTGVSDASAGLAPDALQNMTAKASAMIEQAGIGQTELMVSTVAQGLKRFFKGLLRASVRHQDKARTVRLRDEWVQFDPRDWNADMDVTVNTGLGAGTRERDMQMMQVVIAAQEKILAGFGPDNPFVKPDNLYNSIAKMIESAGLKTPSLYITEPDPQEVEARLEAMRNQPDPEQQKLEAQMALEDKKIQSNRDKENAQMQADLTVKQAEIAAHTQAQADKLAADMAIVDKKLAWERDRFDREMQFKREDSERQRQDAIWQHQASNFAQAAE